MIAAGEVVERPSSVVKELFENAADAGADTVTVEIKNGGLTYIRVTDNGCGVPRDQVPHLCRYHTTSKLRDVLELRQTKTLGFRGARLRTSRAWGA
jgi:DNA mismatch repair protein MutL